jgi:cytoskeletal protein CcmA (bactofilin family)
MGTVAHIGSSISIKGEVHAQEPLTIAGRVDGTIDVSGHPLTVTESATVDADVLAHTIVVAGTVYGHLSAEERIVIQQTATLNGEVSAPALTVHDGATVQGKFDVTGNRQPVTLKLAV